MFYVYVLPQQITLSTGGVGGRVSNGIDQSGHQNKPHLIGFEGKGCARVVPRLLTSRNPIAESSLKSPMAPLPDSIKSGKEATYATPISPFLNFLRV